MNSEALQAGEEIWRWLPISDELRKADLIFLFGSISTAVAYRAAELYQQDYAPLILATGGFGHATKSNDSSEADTHARIMQEQGVPRTAILIENRSSNTGENIRFSKEDFQAELKDVQTGIAVATPVYSRRQKASLQKQWQYVEWLITTPTLLSFAERTSGQNADHFLCLIAGEVDRLEKYPAQGFTVEVSIPQTVFKAKDKLIHLGYDKYAVAEL